MPIPLLITYFFAVKKKKRKNSVTNFFTFSEKKKLTWSLPSIASNFMIPLLIMTLFQRSGLTQHFKSIIFFNLILLEKVALLVNIKSGVKALIKIFDV